MLSQNFSEHRQNLIPADSSLFDPAAYQSYMLYGGLIPLSLRWIFIIVFFIFLRSLLPGCATFAVLDALFDFAFGTTVVLDTAPGRLTFTVGFSAAEGAT